MKQLKHQVAIVLSSKTNYRNKQILHK